MNNNASIQQQQIPTTNKGIILRIYDKYPAIKPYGELMRIEKPIGTYLLLYPCLWSLAFAQPLLPWSEVVALASYFGIGATVMRGAGCTINDMWDKNIDKQVERTKMRPLASGAISPMRALVFLAAQLSVGLAVLLQLNTYTVMVGAASLVLVIVYPLMKRVTYWPQLVLGSAFNWGCLVGYASAVGSHDLMNWNIVLPLYAAGICWTLVYDTIYAHQDKKDDALVGVKSTALRFGEHSKVWLTSFALAFAALLLYAGKYGANYDLQQQWPYYVSVAASLLHLLQQVHLVDYNSPKQCLNKFVSNKWIGVMLLAGILAANMLQKEDAHDKVKQQVQQSKQQQVTIYQTIKQWL